MGFEPTLWAARDRNGTLWAYAEQPIRGTDGTFWADSLGGAFNCCGKSSLALMLPAEMYPAITWENSPARLFSDMPPGMQTKKRKRK